VAADCGGGPSIASRLGTSAQTRATCCGGARLATSLPNPALSTAWHADQRVREGFCLARLEIAGGSYRRTTQKRAGPTARQRPPRRRRSTMPRKAAGRWLSENGGPDAATRCGCAPTGNATTSRSASTPTVGPASAPRMSCRTSLPMCAARSGSRPTATAPPARSRQVQTARAARPSRSLPSIGSPPNGWPDAMARSASEPSSSTNGRSRTTCLRTSRTGGSRRSRSKRSTLTGATRCSSPMSVGARLRTKVAEHDGILHHARSPRTRST